MNWDIIEGNWDQFKGKVKEEWGELTDDHLLKIAGKREQLLGQLQEKYGMGQQEAQREVTDWEHRNQDEFAKTAAAIRALPKSLQGATE